MAHFTIYTKAYCPYCVMAKRDLTAWGHTITEYNAEDETVMNELHERAPGIRTVPQIFIGDYRIGGYTDLVERHKTGALDAIIDMQSS